MAAIRKWNKIIDNIEFDSLDDDFSRVFLNNDAGEFQLSPNTNILFNTWSSLLNQDENLILIYPTTILRPSSLLAYLYSKATKKSSIIYTSGSIDATNDNMYFHNQYYHLCSWENSDYLFVDIPMGYVKNGDLQAKFAMRHVYDKTIKDRIKLKMEDSLLNSKSKIILNSSEGMRLVNFFNNLYFEGKKADGDSFNHQVDVGCIIIENAENFINSIYSNVFFDWIENICSKGIKMLFHFSTLQNNIEAIEKLKRVSNSLLLNFGKNILLEHERINSNSLNYFNNVSPHIFKILKNYNLDLQSDYQLHMDISLLDGLDVGNIDDLFGDAIKLYHRIDNSSLKNKKLFYAAYNLLYSLPNIIMNPSFYKIRVNFPKIGERYIVIQKFLDYYRKQLHRESKINKFLISHFLSKIEGIFFEISKSRRYGDNYSYSRICKDYFLREIISDPVKYLGNDKKIIVGTLSNMEKTYLDKVIKNDNVSIHVLKYLIRSNENFGDYNLILPGILPLEYSSIFYKFFNGIYILNYNGKNREKVQEQINLFSINNLDYKSKKFFTEFYNYFNLASDEFLEPFNDIIDENKDLIKNEEYYKILDDINSKIKSSEIELKESTHVKKVKLELHGVNNNKVLIKELSDDRKFLHFKDYTNLDKSQENTPGKIPLDDYMILLEEYSSFRSMFKEVFFPNLEIDFEFADYWRDKLYHYFEENEFTYEEFYNLYRNSGGTNGKQSVISWIKGKIMAPNDKNQLKILGQIMKDDFLIENYEDIFNECRKITDLNKNLGRKIGHLIRNIVRNNRDYMDLSCEEQFMYDKINNNIYKVVSKINC